MLGANLKEGRAEFRVWAPRLESLAIELNESQTIPLTRDPNGVFVGSAPARAGDRYFCRVGDKLLPDPVSRFLPEGVHGHTEIVDPAGFRWSDASWRGLAPDQYVIYELHVGTFTPEGTFDGVIGELRHLRELGITAIEIMPVAAFPGTRNWGYDGVSLYAVQASYGGPEGLKRLVDAAHREGLAVMLDVVYNHFGPEGNYLREFGPYFTDKHHTVWGDAINYDQPGCEHVRRFVIENALYWLREYHIDGLRLDAIQSISDESPTHIIRELVAEAHNFACAAGRKVCIIAESDENDRKLILPQHRGGFGLDGVWSDDFHHSVHTVLTGEHRGYYQDYGNPEQIARALNEGFVFQGEHFRFWNKARGTSTAGIPRPRHVFCIQNHDQVGNRCFGERLSHLVSREAAKAAAALLLLAPETPLLFMGEEYAEPAPFQFFTDFGDETLKKAVVEGRKKEFAEFGWDETPNPQDPETFERSKLTWQIDEDMLSWYRRLLELRRKHVTYAERTCHATVHGDEITVEIPANRPTLKVQVALRGRLAPHNEGAVLIESEDERASVRIVELQPQPKPEHTIQVPQAVVQNS